MPENDESSTSEPAPKNSVRVALGANVRRIRDIRSMTVRDLSARLRPLGFSLSPSGVSEIENATRKVSVEELLTLAIALNTSVIDLILPAADENLTIAKDVELNSATSLYWWLRGDGPWPDDPDLWEDFAKAARDGHRAQLFWNKTPLVFKISSLEGFARLAEHPDRKMFGGTLSPAARKALDEVNQEFGALIERIEKEETTAADAGAHQHARPPSPNPRNQDGR